MIEAGELERMSQTLWVYDVVQGAWEQEYKGFDANVGHVLFHLAKDLTSKDFRDETVVTTAIAPDSVQYALRLGRWGHQKVEALLPTVRTPHAAIRAADITRVELLPQAAHAEAISTIAMNLHGADHESTRREAQRQRPAMVRHAAGLLLLSADLQSQDYGFDLAKVFDDRLQSLRNRFGIPQPV